MNKTKEMEESQEVEEIQELRETQELKDIVQKDFISFPDVAADVINVLLYQGDELTVAGSLLAAPTETIYQGIERLRNQFEDLCKYEMVDGKVVTMYLIANQSKVDKKMLLRKAGYVGGAYRAQYDWKTDVFPVIEMVLYWGRSRWKGNRDTRRLFGVQSFPKAKWKYVDKMRLHIFEMRYLPEKVRKLFKSDMRIVVDYLAEGECYRSGRKIVHKAALIKMIKALSGETVKDGEVEKWLEECQIKEEDEVTVCELFDQYERRGRAEGISLGFSQGMSQGISQGMSQGISQGIVKGRIEDILELLEDYGEIPDKLQEKIFEEKDMAVLKCWLKVAARVNSIEEFQDAM